MLPESDDTVVVEGNRYFPPESLRREHFVESRSRSLCPWKGIARYYSLTVGGVTRPDAAWYYPRPTPMARRETATKALGEFAEQGLLKLGRGKIFIMDRAGLADEAGQQW